MQNSSLGTCCKTALSCMTQNLFNEKSILVHVMTWHCKPLPAPMLPFGVNSISWNANFIQNHDLSINIRRGISQYHCCWCPGSFCCEDIKRPLTGLNKQISVFHEEGFELPAPSQHQEMIFYWYTFLFRQNSSAHIRFNLSILPFVCFVV